MRRLMVLLVLLSLPAGTVPAEAEAPPPAPLLRAVIVMRHGVRSPTEAPAKLARYAAEPWPAWPVGPGLLTPHGAAAAKLFGAWLASSGVLAPLLPAGACPKPGTVFAYADGADERTRDTAAAVLAGMAPGCGLTAGNGGVGKPDPLFDAAEVGGCTIDAAAAEKSVTGRLSAGLAAPVPGYAGALQALEGVLAPKGCTGAGGCLGDGANTLKAGAKGVDLRGPLHTGASLGESLALEYEEGMVPPALGWGRLDLGTLTKVMALHSGYSALVRQDPEIAAHNGANLAQAVLAGLTGKPPLPGGAGVAAPVTLIVGHDTNIANLAGILGVNWHLPNQPDATPPDGALLFLLRQPKLGPPVVNVFFVYQSADELRTLTPLAGKTPPGVLRLFPAGCGAATCSVSAFTASVRAALPQACLWSH